MSYVILSNGRRNVGAVGKEVTIMKCTDLTRLIVACVMLVGSIDSVPQSQAAARTGENRTPFDIPFIGVDDLRPDTFSDNAFFRNYVPDVVTLPQHLKSHGYFTQSFGKIFHGEWKTAYVREAFQDPVSWS